MERNEIEVPPWLNWNSLLPFSNKPQKHPALFKTGPAIFINHLIQLYINGIVEFFCAFMAAYQLHCIVVILSHSIIDLHNVGSPTKAFKEQILKMTTVNAVVGPHGGKCEHLKLYKICRTSRSVTILWTDRVQSWHFPTV